MYEKGATIHFDGVTRELQPGEAMSFGRGSTDLDLGDNPILHRRFGRIFWRAGGLWLHNEGSRLPLAVHDRTSTSSVKLAAGREVSLSFPEAAVRFEAGTTTYEILIDLRGTAPTSPESGYATGTEPTIDHSRVPLTADQRLLLVCMAASKLTDPHVPLELPTNKSIAHRLGWTSNQFNRKLDRLCAKFDRIGVSGLVGDTATLAVNRRVRLVDYVLESGLIGPEDLELLPEQAK